tara:strand:+ start:2372 stop:2899 length:528 start_codon:yes stop_codon:yes gene_type:complete
MTVGTDMTADWWKEKGAAKVGKVLDPGISWSETKDSFAPEVENLAAMRAYDPQGLTEGQKQTAMTTAAKQAAKGVAAQQAALQDPSAVGQQTASSIKRTQAIAGEGAKEIAEGAALTSAEVEGLSEEIARGERDWKSSEIQRMLANIAAFREMKAARSDEVFDVIGGAASAVLSA